MHDDRQVFEFAYALYLARRVDREAAQMIVAAAEAGVIDLWDAVEALVFLWRRAAPIPLSGLRQAT